MDYGFKRQLRMKKDVELPESLDVLLKYIMMKAVDDIYDDAVKYNAGEAEVDMETDADYRSTMATVFDCFEEIEEAND